MTTKSRKIHSAEITVPSKAKLSLDGHSAISFAIVQGNNRDGKLEVYPTKIAWTPKKGRGKRREYKWEDLDDMAKTTKKT